MTEPRHDGDASDATLSPIGAPDATMATATDDTNSSDLRAAKHQPPQNGDASDAKPAPDLSLADALEYTLTVKQAAELFARNGRKVPSERSLQRYCDPAAPLIRGLKIKTTYGQEWLINEPSLIAYIDTLPIEPEASAPTTPAATDTVAMSDASDASDAKPTHHAGNATDDSAASGETRRLTDVLIDNARLIAQIEGRDALLATMRDEKTFLRSELIKRDEHAQQILETFKAIGSRQLPPPDDDEPVTATILNSEE